MLVARIALYPDELIAVISGAALYPLQIVEAARYLDQYAKDKSLKPKDSWDGSVVSLLNYPEIVKMMSDDLDWTQQLGDALAYQQKDVLVAIQQLREEAVAKGIIKTDDKVKVVEENDNIVIQSASTEKVYVPRYEPEMLYEPGYAVAPISYYPEPYPSYWYPTATFFAAAVTGASPERSSSRRIRMAPSTAVSESCRRSEASANSYLACAARSGRLSERGSAATVVASGSSVLTALDRPGESGRWASIS